MASDRLQRFLMWFFAIVLVVGTVAALRYARGYRPLAGFGYSGPSDLPADIALRFENVHVSGRRDNRKAWTIAAGQVQTTATRTRLDFSRGITATLLDNDRPRAVVTGPQATYDANAKVLVAAGQINCRIHPKAGQSGSDLSIDAAEVVWSVGSHVVSCPGPVQARLDGTVLSGTDLAVDLQTREQSLHNFKATVPLSDLDSGGPVGSVLKGIAP
jgi:hypothetical protein